MPEKTPVAELLAGPAVPGSAKLDPILVVDRVSRQFGGLTAVDVDHLEIPRGAITALIGPNGAGKTTLFNLLTGFDKPDGGSWTFDGRKLGGIPAFKVAQGGMVRTFQLTKALNAMTVMENMRLGAGHQSGENVFTSLVPALWRKREAEITAQAEGLLARFKLDTKADDYAGSLSGGQRKLLEMARALMSEPKMIMLDEPMAGVNPALTQSLLQHILGLKAEGRTVLFVEHDMHMVNEIADWVVVMAEGRIVAEGPASSVMSDPAVIDAYLGAHHDADLGTIRGQLAVAEEMDSELVKEEVEAEAEEAGIDVAAFEAGNVAGDPDAPAPAPSAGAAPAPSVGTAPAPPAPSAGPDHEEGGRK